MKEAVLNRVFEKFKNSTVLVVGDVMIDCYISGKVSRISPEAPVPVVNAQKREYRLGGAANVALNIKSLGATPILCSVVGNDNKSKVLYNLMQEYELDSLGIIPMTGRKTTVKYRIIGNNAHVARIDDESDKPLAEREQKQFLTTVEQLIEHTRFDAIVFEDYDKGLFTKELIDELVVFAKRHNLFIAVDPKRRNFGNYKEVNLFKPNLKELAHGLHIEDSVDMSVEQIHAFAKCYAEEKHIEKVMITMSERGVAFYDHAKDRFYHQMAFRRRVSDVSGAGDTVIAVATLCLLNGYGIEFSSQVSNLAGGIVCEYVGVVPVNLAQLKREMNEHLTVTE